MDESARTLARDVAGRGFYMKHYCEIVCATMLLCVAGGCMSTAEAELASGDSEDFAPATVEPTRIALRAGASVTPDDVEGFCNDGVGVYLSATTNTAELIVYVVPPAESAVFVRPALHLTTQQGDGQATDVMQFETTELQVGESQVFSKQSDGALLDVVAELGAE
jgi:hypothetical protein